MEGNTETRPARTPRKSGLTELQLALMGKGMIRSTKPIAVGKSGSLAGFLFGKTRG